MCISHISVRQKTTLANETCLISISGYGVAVVLRSENSEAQNGDYVSGVMREDFRIFAYINNECGELMLII